MVEVAVSGTPGEAATMEEEAEEAEMGKVPAASRR